VISNLLVRGEGMGRNYLNWTKCKIKCGIKSLFDDVESSARVLETFAGLASFARSADWKSAIQQVGNLRYV
jgi:hypothetical protein